jgi:hypothetical protein
MLHKISQMCDKIDFIKTLSDRLRDSKYEEPKASKDEINRLIEDIRYECLLISQDKSDYQKVKK